MWDKDDILTSWTTFLRLAENPDRSQDTQITLKKKICRSCLLFLIWDKLKSAALPYWQVSNTNAQTQNAYEYACNSATNSQKTEDSGAAPSAAAAFPAASKPEDTGTAGEKSGLFY